MVEDGTSGVRMAATAVPGLVFPQAQQQTYQAPQGSPQAYQQYPRSQGYDPGAGQKDVNHAWIFGVLGLCCCGLIFGILGLNAAKRAEQVGHPGANAAKIFNIVVLVLWVLGIVLRGIMAASGNG